MQQAILQMAAEAVTTVAQVNVNTNATTNESAIKNGEINSGGIESLRHKNDGTANVGSNEITKQNIKGSLDMNDGQADQSKGLEDQKEYQDIMGDIADTCQEYGKLLSIVIPKRGEEGCGRVFLEYQTRTFNNNVITAHFFDEAAFEKSEFGKQL
ncbi:hypothetical protein RFI_31572 [Reticulomyxa filosa]|uniref:Uncharacterized protein n=1 Tax=Reticulomyxa filosa TaxID=46433 RepID=X6LW26_RETFI|nr:hypothetical protein RFI_31572 [Reticulomyxa filosa]|eukprot:ETO05824.1 hypothetical protein RFI_31572 [Reticulomyxa filosa]